MADVDGKSPDPAVLCAEDQGFVQIDISIGRDGDVVELAERVQRGLLIRLR